MKSIGKLIAVILISSIAFSACKKPLEYPLVPNIDFKSIVGVKDANGKDQYLQVTIGFTDGDGDIGYFSPESGLNDPMFDFPADATNPYYTNFKVKTYRLINNVWTVDTVDLSARIPYLTPLGSNKALKGEIQRELPLDIGLVNDTFYYEIFIYDRSLHQSNTVKTSNIVINT
ncbi:MAG TPA: hypothetical protein PLZ91_05300 [Bacteroidia bacterium]|jgi:hypothetical protein|nr:hypothetical protein [Bacteroidota bacterium]MBK8587486.1 hypothetical protein [Bacteroidota bacterium]MBP9797243.1 hypothetical protein [Chitinophagales bacterium]HQV99718.1 hypothetical protein [Bacteroidia bacterium]